MDGDLISREALKKAICLDEIISVDETWEQLYDAVVKAIDNAQPVEPKVVFVPVCELDPKKLQEIVDKAIEEMQVNAEKSESKWIPITMRPIEEDEKDDFPDATFMFDCHMPENGEEILITTKYGVEFDTCYNDDGYYLDSNRSWDEVFAWMPLPEAYKKGGAE